MRPSEITLVAGHYHEVAALALNLLKEAERVRTAIWVDTQPGLTGSYLDVTRRITNAPQVPYAAMRGPTVEGLTRLLATAPDLHFDTVVVHNITDLLEGPMTERAIRRLYARITRAAKPYGVAIVGCVDYKKAGLAWHRPRKARREDICGGKLWGELAGRVVYGTW